MSSKSFRGFKNVFGGAAFLLILGWLAVLTMRQNRTWDEDGNEIHVNDVSGRQKRSVGSRLPNPGGATYIRWGRTACPSDAELVYKGIAGGSHYTQTGGGGDYVCLSEEPKYANTKSGNDPNAVIYGAELQVSNFNPFDGGNSNPNPLHDSNVKCAVCRSHARTSMVMIPGTNECPGNGWNKEYWGYLMTEHYAHKATRDFVCVDNAPDRGTEGGFKNEDGALMYPVEGRCGSLPCQPYNEGHELACVVCTK